MTTLLLKHAAIFPVLLPILSCLALLLLGHIFRGITTRLLKWFLLLCSFIFLYNATYLQQQIATTQFVAYYLGGWIPPFGIEVRVDSFSGFILSVVATVNLVAVAFTVFCCNKEQDKHDPIIFWSLWLLAYTGLAGMVITADLFNLYVFLEISSLATYALVAGGPTRNALSAGFTYLIIGSFGAAFFFTGLIFLYILTGTLNMEDISQVIASLPVDRTFIAAFCFMALGLAIKAAIFPVHLWLPDVYTFAPSGFTVFMIGTATKVSLYALVRVAILLTNVVAVNPELALQFVAFTLVLSSFFACVQCNYRQVLAYSSIAQLSFIIICLLIASPLTIVAGITYFYVHALTKMTLLISLLVMAPGHRFSTLHALRGSYKRSPLAVGFFLYAAASLIGLPGTPGFLVKWNVLLGMAQQQQPNFFALGAVIISTFLALIYLSRIAWQIFAPANRQATANAYNKTNALVILALLTVAMLYLTFYPQILFEPAELVLAVLR